MKNSYTSVLYGPERYMMPQVHLGSPDDVGIICLHHYRHVEQQHHLPQVLTLGSPAYIHCFHNAEIQTWACLVRNSSITIYAAAGQWWNMTLDGVPSPPHDFAGPIYFAQCLRVEMSAWGMVGVAESKRLAQPFKQPVTSV